MRVGMKCAALCLFTLVSLTGCAPKHTHTVGFLKYEAENGYTFIDPNDAFKGVKWLPETPSTTWAHVVAASTEGRWIPQDGYSWVNPEDETENNVVWTPNMESRLHPHILTGATESQWSTTPGYKWVYPDNANDLSVIWTPGSAHPYYEHVLAAAQEGYWRAEVGYHFVDPKQNLQVAADYETPAQSGPDWGAVIVHGLAALAFNDCAQQRDKDGVITTFVVRPGCKAASDEEVKNAFRAMNLR